MSVLLCPAVCVWWLNAVMDETEQSVWQDGVLTAGDLSGSESAGRHWEVEWGGDGVAGFNKARLIAQDSTPN